MREINSEVLFGNLREVTCVSHDLVEALRGACGGEDGRVGEGRVGEGRVGEVFVTFGPRLRAAYACYCSNLDNASSLVEKVCRLLSLIGDFSH